MAKNISKDFQNMQRQMAALLDTALPNEAMSKAEELVQDAFDKEQYQGDDPAPSKWKARKREKEPDRNERRGLLVKSGKLRASVETVMRGRTLVISAGYSVGTWNLAQIHNEGLKPQPERQFMPKPGEAMPALDKLLEGFMDREFDIIFKN